MTAHIHDFPADVSTLASCREVLRCEGSTPDQIAVACDYLWEHSADYTDLVTVKEIRRAMADRDARRAADDAREQRAWRVVGWVLVVGWAVIAAAIAWRASMGAV